MIKRELDWKYQVKGGLKRFKVFAMSYKALAREENHCIGSLEDLHCRKKVFYDEKKAVAYSKYLNRGYGAENVYVLEQHI